MTATATAALPTGRLRPVDVVRVGVGSLGARAARTVLTALGIAIGIAALVSVVGISSSSRADLLAQLDKFGTNLLEVRAGQSVFGEAATLPEEAPSMIRRIGPVDDVSAVAGLSATVRRTDLIPASETGGIAVDAATTSLLTTVGGTLAEGRFLDSSTEALPAVVLGSTAATRLGIESLEGSPMVWIGDRWWAVIGILDPVPLLSSLDSAVMIGFDAAADLLGSRRKGVEHLRANGAEVGRIGTRGAGSNDESVGTQRGVGRASVRCPRRLAPRSTVGCVRCCWHSGASRCWSEASVSPT